jgi:hypothetical protein
MSRGVALLGLGLVLANTATSHLKDLRDVVSGKSSDPTATHGILIAIIGQVLFVLILAMIADWSDEFGTIIIALLIGLWLVWAVGNADKISTVGKLLGVTQ